MQAESVFLERVHQRAAELEAQSLRRRIYLIQTFSAAAGMAAAIAIALTMPKALPETEKNQVVMQASIFSENGSLGYIVVALMAFLLGIGVTMLCFKLRQYLRKQEEQHDRDR